MRIFHILRAVAVIVLCATIPAIAQEPQDIDVNSGEAIPVGPFLFTPAIELSWQYRDNIFFEPDNEVADHVYLARARLAFELPIYESYLRFSYTPQWRDYKDFEFTENWGHFVDVTGAFEFSSGLALDLQYRFVNGALETREVDPGGELLPGDVSFVKNYGAVRADYWFTQRDGITLEGRFQTVDHEDPELFYDFDRADAWLGWLHQINPTLVMDLRYGFSQLDVDETTLQYRNSQSNDLTLGFRGQFSPTVSTAIYLGYRETTFDRQPTDPDFEDFKDMIARGWVNWDFAHGSSLRLDLIRSDYPSNFQINPYYVATGGSLIYNLDRGRFLAQARARIQNNDYPLPDVVLDEERSDDITTFGLGLAYRLTEFTTLRGNYLYEKRDTLYPYSYTTNIYTLGLVFGY